MKRVSFFFFFQLGLTPRTLGVMPEKAVKLKVVDLAGQWIDRHGPHRADPQATGHLFFLARWGLCGAAGGVVTTLVGESIGSDPLFCEPWERQGGEGVRVKCGDTMEGLCIHSGAPVQTFSCSPWGCGRGVRTYPDIIIELHIWMHSAFKEAGSA